jgi:hypothetical protein
MKTLKKLSIIALFIFLSSCQSDPLEKYFVDATENGDFFVTGIPTSFVQFDKDKLDAETLKQIASIKKVNILLYQNNEDIKKKISEYQKAKQAISQKHYKTLAKMNDAERQLSFSYLGKADKIDEIIFFGRDREYNFLISKIKGKNVELKNLIKAFKNIKNIDRDKAKPVLKMFEGFRIHQD